MAEHEFRLRNTVCLVGNTGIMVVEEIHDTHVLCGWYQDGVKIQDTFNAKDLVLVQW
jgi:hypothetical protein